MVSVETLREQFEALGAELDDDVIEKCKNRQLTNRNQKILFCLHQKNSGLEICTLYNIDDPEELVDAWMAFSVTKYNGANPTVQSLIDFENQEFKNQKKSNKSKNSGASERSQLKVYNQESDDDENEILGSYVCITPKVSWHC